MSCQTPVAYASHAALPDAHTLPCPAPLPLPPSCLQEDDVIGLLSGDDISKLQPLQDRVLIEVVEAADKTSGGLLLTEGSKERLTMGKVGWRMHRLGGQAANVEGWCPVWWAWRGQGGLSHRKPSVRAAVAVGVCRVIFGTAWSVGGAGGSD